MTNSYDAIEKLYCDVKFNQRGGNGQKFRHIELLSYTVVTILFCHCTRGLPQYIGIRYLFVVVFVCQISRFSKYLFAKLIVCRGIRLPKYSFVVVFVCQITRLSWYSFAKLLVCRSIRLPNYSFVVVFVCQITGLS